DNISLFFRVKTAGFPPLFCQLLILLPELFHLCPQIFLIHSSEKLSPELQLLQPAGHFFRVFCHRYLPPLLCLPRERRNRKEPPPQPAFISPFQTESRLRQMITCRKEL